MNSSKSQAAPTDASDIQTSRRDFLKGSSAALLSATLGHRGAAAAESNSASEHRLMHASSGPEQLPVGYNILFILVDQERYFSDWPFAVPGREKLTRRGITFANHQIASCVCSPSRSTIYTGQHMQHTGIFDNAGLPWQPDMSQDIRTVGHMMRDAGYHPAYVGKWHLSSTMHETQSPYDAPVAQYNQTMRRYGFDDYFGVGDLVGSAHGGYTYDGVTTEAAVSWLRTRKALAEHASKPWFLAVNLVNPHDAMWMRPAGKINARGLLPTLPPPDDELYQRRWMNVPLPASYTQPLDAPGRPAAHAMYGAAHTTLLGQFSFNTDNVRRYQDYYFNCIRDCDQHILRLLNELENLKLDERTIIVLTSDHGDLGGYHQLIDKGANTYQQQNHVPLIVSHPAYPGQKTCRALTSHVDIAPTLLALTGLDDEKLAQTVGRAATGRSFAHLMRNPETAAVDAIRPAALFSYAMLLYYDSEWMLAEFKTMRERGIPPAEMHRRAAALQPDLHLRGAIRSVFDGRYRFSRYFALADFNRPTTLADLFAHNDVELYDLHADPGEMTNLAMHAGKHGDLLLAMNDKLNNQLDQEVGRDSINSLPFVNDRLQFHFKPHPH